ncbi:hypothetical protein ACRJ4B_46010 [Streptomyces sp. GTA36]
MAGVPQKPRRSRACLWGCVGALAAVVVIVVVVVVLVVALAGSDGSPENPPSADVRVTSCGVDAATRLPSAGLEIHNHSSKTSTYGVTVEFRAPNGTRLSEGAALSLTVAPGQEVTTTAAGKDQVTQKVTCKVTKVNRIAG